MQLKLYCGICEINKHNNKNTIQYAYCIVLGSIRRPETEKYLCIIFKVSVIVFPNCDKPAPCLLIYRPQLSSESNKMYFVQAISDVCFYRFRLLTCVRKKNYVVFTNDFTVFGWVRCQDFTVKITFKLNL